MMVEYGIGRECGLRQLPGVSAGSGQWPGVRALAVARSECGLLQWQGVRAPVPDGLGLTFFFASSKLSYCKQII